MTSNIIQLDEAARDGRAANRVGGATHETTAAHRKGIDWHEGPWAHQPEPQQESYLARYSMAWLVFAVSFLTAGLIFAFGPDLIVKAAASISFYLNY